MTSVVFVTYDIRGVIKIPTSQSKIWWPYWLPWQWNEFFLHFGWYFAFFEKILRNFFAFWISILLKIIRTIRTTLSLIPFGEVFHWPISCRALDVSQYYTRRYPYKDGLDAPSAVRTVHVTGLVERTTSIGLACSPKDSCLTLPWWSLQASSY